MCTIIHTCKHLVPKTKRPRADASLFSAGDVCDGSGATASREQGLLIYASSSLQNQTHPKEHDNMRSLLGHAVLSMHA